MVAKLKDIFNTESPSLSLSQLQGWIAKAKGQANSRLESWITMAEARLAELTAHALEQVDDLESWFKYDALVKVRCMMYNV